jgi:competence CoiA-like predicted nuclease
MAKVEFQEVYLSEEDETHRADICTSEKIVIEIQNSPITADEIYTRECFYDKLIWVINSSKFKHNIFFKSFQNVENQVRRFWDSTIINDKTFMIVSLPVNDFNDQILKSLKECNYQELSDKKWIKRPPNSYSYKLDDKVYQAISNHILDWDITNRAYEKKLGGCSFRWKNFRKSWLYAENIFIDLNNDYLFHIKSLHENGRGYGKFVEKRYFVERYNK